MPIDPDQSAPTPEEIRTEPHVQDAQDAIFVLRESLAVASWRDFGATIEPILTRLYHAAKREGAIEATDAALLHSQRTASDAREYLMRALAALRREKESR